MRGGGYYPLQIPYLLDRSFQAHILYEESRPPELSGSCMCIWQMRSRAILDKTIYNYILPDACIDLVIDFSKRTICFAGFSRETIPFALDQKIDYMGVRMRPGAFHLLFGVSAERVMDHPVDFSELEHPDRLSGIFAAAGPGERLDILKAYLLEKTEGSFDTAALQTVERLYREPADRSVAALARELHCGERQLYRIFKTNYGISPKVMLDILRLHLCLTLVLERSVPLTDIAGLCGFYDQAHFIREVKRYTGFSPLRLLGGHR